jgi:hypothetical protein
LPPEKFPFVTKSAQADEDKVEINRAPASPSCFDFMTVTPLNAPLHPPVASRLQNNSVN